MPAQTSGGGRRRGNPAERTTTPSSNSHTIRRNSADFAILASNSRRSTTVSSPSTYSVTSSSGEWKSGMIILQGFAQGQQTTPNPGLYRAQRFTGGVRDLLMRPSADKSHLHRVRLLIGKAVQGRRANIGKFFTLDSMHSLNLQFERCYFPLIGRMADVATRASAKAIHCQSPRDHDH